MKLNLQLRIFKFLKSILRQNNPSRTFRVLPASNPNLEYLAKIGREIYFLSQVNFEGLNIVDHNVRFLGRINLGYATTVGEDSRLIGTVTLGKYCQIAPRVCFQGNDHNYEFLTTYNNSNLFNGDLKENTIHAPITVGHSVWIGLGAIILKGVNIGNGAVIGAGSVVTKDVPAYKIAVGNPARVVRQRFDDELCGLIDQSSWWELSVSELAPHKPLFFQNLNADRESTIAKLQKF